MKILIAFDGSEYAYAALNDLRRAGLPKTAEAMIVTVADVFIPPPSEEGEEADPPAYEPPSVRKAHERALRELERTRAEAENAGQRVREMFPDWKVTVEAHADSPAWALIRRTDEWRPDLIVLGAKGQSSWAGRLILGSVAQKVLYEAPGGSVRVARSHGDATDGPVRIIIGLDGSPDSALAVDAVAERNWPAGSEARIVVALGGAVKLIPNAEIPDEEIWIASGNDEDLEIARKAFEPAVKKLSDAGLNTTLHFPDSRPKRVLVEEATNWNADSIFVGATGMRGVGRFLLGSVAAAVAERAPCSVEVVRPKTGSVSA